MLHNQLEGCARAGLVPRVDDLRADFTRVLVGMDGGRCGKRRLIDNVA